MDVEPISSPTNTCGSSCGLDGLLLFCLVLASSIGPRFEKELSAVFDADDFLPLFLPLPLPCFPCLPFLRPLPPRRDDIAWIDQTLQNCEVN